MPFDKSIAIDAVAARTETDRFGLQHLAITWDASGHAILDGQMSVVRLDDKGAIVSERQAPRANVILTADQAKALEADFDAVFAKVRAVMESAYQANEAQREAEAAAAAAAIDQ